MISFGVGTVNLDDAMRSGREAAESALRSAGLVGADLALAFCAGSLDAESFFAGVRAALGPATPIVGGSAAGVIASDYLSYRGSPAGVAVIQSEDLHVDVAAAAGLDLGEAHVGEQLVHALNRRPDDRLLLTFFDSIRIAATADTPAHFNSASTLLDGVERVLGTRLPVAGAGLFGGFDFGPSRQFAGDRVVSQHAVGCLLSGPVVPYITVLQGCIPLDGVYRRITGMEGEVIHDLDGQPVVEIVDEFFADEGWRSQHPITSLALGTHQGPRYSAPTESAFVNRLIAGISPDGRGIGVFAPDLAVGTDVQFMLRDNQTMLATARDHTRALLAQIEADGCLPAFALYFDCGGRNAAQSFTTQEEAAVLQGEVAAAGVPLFGMYSAAEIAPLLGRNRGFEWTGVLVVVAEARR